MAYATVEDMVVRYGEIEMIRLSTRDDALPESIDGARVNRILDDAAAVIDGYLRVRYALPLAPTATAAWGLSDSPTGWPPELIRACATLARCDLAQGGEQSPSKEMKAERDGIMTWLRDLSTGEVRLDAIAAGTASGARVQDRPREFTGQGLP